MDNRNKNKKNNNNRMIVMFFMSRNWIKKIVRLVQYFILLLKKDKIYQSKRVVLKNEKID